MPIPEIDGLNKTSAEAQVKAAMSVCIATEIRAGRSQDQAVAICYQMMKEKIGKMQAPAVRKETTMEQKTQEQVRSQEHRRSLIGFLTVEPTSDNTGLIGAVLITDERGYPLEFRCTTPVRPTAIQRTLYGALLKPYVSVELCGRRLLAEIQRKPMLVV